MLLHCIGPIYIKSDSRSAAGFQLAFCSPWFHINTADLTDSVVLQLLQYYNILITRERVATGRCQKADNA